MAQKYFRKAGVPQPDGAYGRETSAKQVAHRLANCWKVWEERNDYFASAKMPLFYEEVVYCMLNQACKVMRRHLIPVGISPSETARVINV